MSNTSQELRAQAADLEAQAVALETTQLTRTDLAGLDAEQISQAKNEGRLNVLLGITTTTKEN